ncbi:hypothetical protein Tdes44962_MAKER00903 [Teratosphaeria destructans]|uniref:Uncharacterized protein n=1 Tax=Teratosphaeria destructans TaxID=418781 RepID=A0A9W7VYU0_9PEZI|nr:hypothetical protein Tdes44962_MAKER00903 [Teratosphaeria destructans]
MPPCASEILALIGDFGNEAIEGLVENWPLNFRTMWRQRLAEVGMQAQTMPSESSMKERMSKSA